MRILKLTLSLIIAVTMMAFCPQRLWADTTPDYLCFTAVNDGTYFSLNLSSTDDVKLEYSFDPTATTWEKLYSSNIYLEKGQKVYFRAGGTNGKNATFSTKDKYYNFNMNSEIAVSGNIMSLLDATCQQTYVPDYAFNNFFRSTGITSTPSLPATKVGAHSYEQMFENCPRLTKAADIKATELGDRCCCRMFATCPALAEGPSILPATTLSDGCYYEMFTTCKCLTQAPALPATKLAKRCYYDMFNGCTSLATAPDLPATELTDSCYMSMLGGTAITTAPALPATTMARSCYESMFGNCANLKGLPELPAKVLAPRCYANMFDVCTSLETLPELPATTLADSCYYRMFLECTSLCVGTTATDLSWSIPAGVQTATDWNFGMFFATCGSFMGSPAAGTTYYLTKGKSLSMEKIDDVWQISTPEELLWFADCANNYPDLSYNAKLINDIDLGSLLGDNVGQQGKGNYGWRSICGATDADYEGSYCGTFDGNGHTISNMNIWRKTSGNDYNIGLFGRVSGKIKNLTVSGNVDGLMYTGMIAGRLLSGGKIINCHAKGSVTGSGAFCGGIVGLGTGCTITDCSNEASVATTQDYCIGGIVGKITDSESTVTRCSNTGSVTAAATTSYISDGTGGILGFGLCDIKNCFNSGAISGYKLVGGIAGKCGIISQCLSTGDISGDLKYETGVLGGSAEDGGNNFYLSTISYKLAGEDAAIAQFGGTAGSSDNVKTLAQLSQGDVCYALNGDQSEIAWYQRIGTDAMPVLKYDKNGLVSKSANCQGEFLNYNNQGITIVHPSESVTHHEAVEYNCTTSGAIEYWDCSTCGKKFSDASMQTEVTNVVVTATGHNIVNGFCTRCGWADGTLNEGHNVLIKIPGVSNPNDKKISSYEASVFKYKALGTGKATFYIDIQYEGYFSIFSEDHTLLTSTGIYYAPTTLDCDVERGKTYYIGICRSYSNYSIKQASVDITGDWNPTLSYECGEGGTISVTNVDTEVQNGSIFTAADNTELTATATPAEGYSFEKWVDQYGVSVSSDQTYTFTMSRSRYLKPVFSCPVKLNADGAYEIGNSLQFNWFVDLVNTNPDVTYNAILTNDIDMSSSDNPIIDTFRGVLDGQNHKITVKINRTKDNAALITNLYGTVKNLTVAGTIITSMKYAAGICANSYGGKIICCTSLVDIESSYESYAYYAGICSTAMSAGLTIDNCLFAGCINAPNATWCGGLVSQIFANSIDISNSLVIGAVNGKNTSSYTFTVNYNRAICTNCYYKNSLGTIPSGTTQVTDEQLASGEVTYLLNGSTNSGEMAWGQNLETQNIPQTSGEGVYYNRAMTNQWGTLVLPFDVDYSADNNGCQFYILSNANPSELTFMKYKSGTIAAGTPVVVKRLAGDAIEFVPASVPNFTTSVTATTDANDWTLNGTLSTLTGQTGMYYIAGDKFWKATEAITIPAFRGWFTTTASDLAKSLSIKEVDETDGIEKVENGEWEIGNSPCYNLSGQCLSAPHKGINIVKGKKIIVK